MSRERGTAVQQLGTLVTDDARKIWVNQARDFTRWMRDNAELLGEGLGRRD